MITFPLEKLLSIRFNIPGLFAKNLRSRYLYLASKINLPVDDSVPGNVPGFLTMLRNRGYDTTTYLALVTELFNNIEWSLFANSVAEFRQWLNVPCNLNSGNQVQVPRSFFFIFAGTRYLHDKKLLARIMKFTMHDTIPFFEALFETGTSIPYFNEIVNELAILDINACLELSEAYPDHFYYSFWAAISKIDFDGLVLSRAFETPINLLQMQYYRDSCIFEVDETLLTTEERAQVWERNNGLLNNALLAERVENFIETFTFLNN